MFSFKDSHAHLVECLKSDEKAVFRLLERADYSVLASVNCIEDFRLLCDLKSKFPGKIGISFGSLAQSPSMEVVNQLEQLLQTEPDMLDAIGECGIDLFSKELKSSLALQSQVFSAQIELAKKYKKILVIHQRKAMAQMFSFSTELEKVPAIIFHGYSGTAIEAQSMLSKKVNAYFSFGKSILRGDKKTMECLKTLPRERILFETDSPYQLPLEKIFDIVELCAKL